MVRKARPARNDPSPGVYRRPETRHHGTASRPAVRGCGTNQRWSPRSPFAAAHCAQQPKVSVENLLLATYCASRTRNSTPFNPSLGSAADRAQKADPIAGDTPRDRRASSAAASAAAEYQSHFARRLIRQRASRSRRSTVASTIAMSARSSASTALTSLSRKPRWRRAAKTFVCTSTR